MKYKVGDSIYLIEKTLSSGMTGNVTSDETYIKSEILSVKNDELTITACPKKKICIGTGESYRTGFWDPNYTIVTKKQYVRGVLHEKLQGFCAISLFITIPWLLSAILSNGTFSMWYYIGAIISAIWIIISLKILGVK